MAPPSPPPPPAAMQQPPSDDVSLTPLAGSAAAAAQNPSVLHGTMASLNLTTATPAAVDGDIGGGSCSRTSPAPAPAAKKKKKSGKDENSIWTRPARKRKPKTTTKPSTASASAGAHPPPPPVVVVGAEEYAAGQPVLLSRVFKSEKIELSADRLGASSCKGYRMVRATHGVAAGAWYFEVKVLHLGPTGHARLGWATTMADLDMPVGADEYGFGYRDADGAKVHRAWRDPYGEEGYGEGDVLGFYISLPGGERYEPQVVFNNRGKPFLVQQGGQDAVANVPGSEIRYFKNGVCQGLAFKDIAGGRYFPAASMYTMPQEPNCVVNFNFGPNFQCFPQDFGGSPIPQPMSEVPH